ncbi:hypothetical protein COO91_07461 [Nostoc flagelliforme CCNUN1]|uniref:Uncharacterized protein n=1 Tax=Nostoc flagelliforme CCNUN1 TaxID=2038116 RepID=A0A2K8T1C4_9NOSO|nr:hypothetical protein COO91_07461 [Nostoc flagelliforme CCNUN1]
MQDNFYKTVSKENITFRIDSDRKAALDAIAIVGLSVQSTN